MLSFLKFRGRLFYGWVVVAAFLIIGTNIWGLRFSFGVFFKSIEGDFELTRTATSAIFSAYMLFGSAFALLGGWVLDRYGPKIVVFLMGLFAGLALLLTSQANASWQLFFSYSLLLAAGTSAMHVMAMSTVSRWFNKKRGLALGIAGQGKGLGIVVIAPFATYLIAAFKWRMAYIVIGLITWLIVIPLSWLLKKEPSGIGVLPDGVKSDSIDTHGQTPPFEDNRLQPTGLSLSQAFRTRSFWSIMLIALFFAFCQFLVVTHLVPHITDSGFTAVDAAIILSLMGGSTIASRVIMGFVSDRIGRKVTAIICALLQAGATLLLIWSNDLWMLHLFAVLYGFAYGGFSPSMSALVGDTFGLSHLGIIMGMQEVGFGIGAAIGPATGGLIYDISRSYSMAFLIGALALLLVALLIIPIRRETYKEE